MAYRINADECVACGSCEDECPVSCISDRGDGVRVIDEDECTSCASCNEVCPVECISEA